MSSVSFPLTILSIMEILRVTEHIHTNTLMQPVAPQAPKSKFRGQILCLSSWVTRYICILWSCDLKWMRFILLSSYAIHSKGERFSKGCHYKGQPSENHISEDLHSIFQII